MLQALLFMFPVFTVPEIRQVIPLSNSGFDTDLGGWSRTSAALWSHATDPAGVNGGTAKFSNSGAAANHSIWQHYDLSLPGSALATPALDRIGSKVEFGGWVYVSANFNGKFYLEINSVDSGGARTNIAKTTPAVDATTAAGEVPRNKWIYVTTEPAQGQDARLLTSTAKVSVVFAVLNATGEVHFDRASFGRFSYGEYAVGDASFELPGNVLPNPWTATGGSILLKGDEGYYGEQNGKFVTQSGTSRLRQNSAINGTATAPHYRQEVEAGAWLRIPSTASLTSISLSIYPAGTGVSGSVAAIASASLSGSDFSPGTWTYVQTESHQRVPFLSGASAVTSLRIELEVNSTAATEVWIDFVQVGQLHGVNGNPRRFVIADYNPYWRAPLITDNNYTGWTPRHQWRNWNSTTFGLYPGCGDCSLDHDPSMFRGNGRRDVATTVDNGTLDELPLVGAYHTLDGNLVQNFQIPLMKEARIDAIAVEYYGHALAVQEMAGVQDGNQNGSNADDKCLDPRGPHFECTLEKLFDVADTTDFKVFPHFILKAHVGSNWLGHPDASAQKNGIKQDLIDMVTSFYARTSCLKVDGKMVIGVFGAQPNLITGSLSDDDWNGFLQEVRSLTGKEIALLDTRMPAQSGYTNGTYLPSFSAVTSWYPYSTVSPFDFRKYSSVCDGMLLSPPIATLGDDYAATLAERAQQWMAFDDENRIGVGFVYADFDDSPVSGWSQSHCVRILAESLDMTDSTWRAVTDEVGIATDEGLDWAFIASWNDWSESHRIEPTWKQSFYDSVFAPGYDPNAADQQQFFDVGTIDWCFGRLMNMEAGISALKGQPAPGGADTDRLLRIAGKYLTTGGWPNWQ